MDVKKIDKLILIFLVLAIISLNYSPIDSFLEKTFYGKQEVLVERIIDGDTVESDIGNIRLLGINTPERGEKYYEEAKDYLKSRIFNKTVRLEFGKEKLDKYNRTLAYIFLENQNINIEIVEKGLANYYFYDGRDKYSDELEEAWQICLDSNVNLCEPSKNKCAQCVNIINSNKIVNNCNFSCNITDWKIKTEGRNNTIFHNETLDAGKEILFKLELIKTGDAIFLWDDEGKLVIWKIIG